MSKNNGRSNNYHGDTSDFPIIDRALAGEQQAYKELYDKHLSKIYLFLMRQTHGNLFDSQDLLQETFLLAFSKLHTFKKESGFHTWLHSIAINVFLMSCRRKKLRLVSIDELRERQVADEGLVVSGIRGENITWDKWGRVQKSEIGKLDHVLENVPNEISVAQLTQNLPPGYKKMIELHDLQGLEYNEIAVKLHCSPGNAKSQRHKAIEKLRKATQIIHA